MGTTQGRPSAPEGMGMSPAAAAASSSQDTPSLGASIGSARNQPVPCSGLQAKGNGGVAVESDCPVPEEYRGNLGVYNVYNTRVDGEGAGGGAGVTSATKPSNRGWFGGWFGGGSGVKASDGVGGVVLDPRNNMPTVARQMMAPGQKTPISTDRQQSTIPKSGTGGTWVYPSPQMFYNALVRKGKADDVKEKDMAAVVSVHNSMNEDTWRRVLTWERLHCDECRNPMLLRFRGRPDDLSPLAMVRKLFGGGVPFDRHDWYVDRCGREVRYVIDYYFHEDKAGSPGQFDLVVRPAADTFESVMDRVKMQVYIGCAIVGIPCPITGNNSAIGKDAVDPNTTAPEQ